MPELPEVETVARWLKPLVLNKRIKAIKIFNPRTILKNYPQKHKLYSQKILNVSRRAKYIVLKLEAAFLLIHLRMTGRLMIEQLKKSDKKHITAAIIFNDHTILYFKDPRRFGTIECSKNLIELNKKLGPEPLSSEFNIKFLRTSLRSHKRLIKSFLLDQKMIAGLGNIYVDEVLWYAKINPNSLSNKIPDAKIKLLVTGIKKILKASIKFNGTTFINFQYGADDSGKFANYLKVFNKAGEKCHDCKKEIIKIKLAQRGTHLCLNCQKLYR